MANAELGGNTAPLQGDRRPVTILFTDIVGSTSIAERLDPEEWREVVAGAHRRVGEAIARYEGTIAQLLGDGVLAFFGAPTAHEDDPARAVQAALDIQAAIVEYAHDLRGYVDGFAMRIGIHTGEVVFGAVGAPGHVEYLALGDAANLAARLQSAAAPGKALVSESTARLARGAFELTSLGEITVKGKAAPVAVYEVAGLKAGSTHPRGLSAMRSPLVGRTSELAALTAALDELCQGHGAIVAVLGEAGLGKSRLVEEAHAWAGRNLCQPPRWLEGRALSYGASLSYWSIRQLMQADLGLSDADPEVRARVALRRRLNALFATEAGELQPYLAHLLGVKPEGQAAERLAALDSETLKYQLLVSIRRYFAALAGQQPLVLVCEDLHWADPSTLDALGELLALTDHAPILLLLVARVEREHGSWRLKVQAETDYAHRFNEILLRPLHSGDAQRLVDNLLMPGKPELPEPRLADDPAGQAGNVPLGESGLPDSLRQLLLDRAEGNPFFLEELAASLVEQGALAREGEAWRLARPVESLSIPETVQGVLLARIDRLEEDVRGTLQMASVIGRSFLYRLLQAVAEAERQLDRHLVVLQRADLVREKAVRPQLEYIFKHSLAQEATYQSLLIERRREFHGRVAAALQAMFAGREEEVYGLLAHHFDLAEQDEPAVRYLITAGDKARLEDALTEAARFYRRAVERLEAAGAAEGAARAWLKLALVYQADFDFAAAHEAYERGFTLRQQARRRDRRLPDQGAVLRMAGSFFLHTLDPARLSMVLEANLATQLFAGLAQIDAELNVVPHGARSWEVLEDGLCYRIHLRPDVRWTDGSPVTAHDYVFAWLRSLDSQAATTEYPACMLDDVVDARAYRLGQLSDPAQVGISALDDLTLEVRLDEPLAYFPYLLAHPVTFPAPRMAVERWGAGWWQPEHMLCNGAFRLAHFEPERIILEHNPLYFGHTNGGLARVEMLIIPDDHERLERFRQGDLDVAPFVISAPAGLAAYLQPSPYLCGWYLILSPQPPLDDLRMRRAIALALDRQSIAGQSRYSPARGGLIPPGMPGHTPGLALPHDPEQTRRLLAEAGYCLDHRLPLRVRTFESVLGPAVVRSLTAVLPAELDASGIEGSYPLEHHGSHLLMGFWGADLPDPDNFLRHSTVLTASLRRTGWQDPELDALLERAAHTQDRAARMALYRQADRRLVAEQVLIVPLMYGEDYGLLSQPWVHGVRQNKMGMLSLEDAVVEKRRG